MVYKAVATALALLPHLLSARVICSFSLPTISGETCESFATEWGQSLQTFQLLNPDVQCPSLVPGQIYCLVGAITEDLPPSPTSPSSPSPPPPCSSSSSKPYSIPVDAYERERCDDVDQIL
ncbi:hypothetical protein BJY04DRAFT_220178 [Aspergillus karnatakaensis]|uniref:LysM peptidoglycan-binding domain-containing protein n=1 Tax=Aspergillus karnatakaensis TaxID=1810916 RepID=UPI003CCE53C8